jgi:tetratricopeptide (TPR) repeat protein
MPRSRAAWWPLFALILHACATRGGGAPAPQGAHDEVWLDPQATALGAGALSAWMIYGTFREVLFEQRGGRSHNRSASDYELELGARQKLVEAWAKDRGQAQKPNEYLDLLLEVQAAGFLDEYVVAQLAVPGWTIPGGAVGSLDLSGFETWAAIHLPAHRAVAMVTVQPGNGPLWPDRPGATLPDPNALARTSCATALPALGQAVADWRREESALDGAPLAAADRRELVRVLIWAHDQPEYLRRGITWVTPTPAELYYLQGFCAVDRGDFGAALAPLEQSARLAPLVPRTRLELSHVLVSQKRFDDADRQIDGVLATTRDRCQRGRAWRQRGFVLVERGHLEQAYAAYQKSLEEDPGSKLALDEMVFIVRELQRQGGPDARAFKPMPTPPSTTSHQVVSQCQDSN